MLPRASSKSVSTLKGLEGIRDGTSQLYHYDFSESFESGLTRGPNGHVEPSGTCFKSPLKLPDIHANLNQLVETGRFFKSDGSLQSRAQMKRNLPVAHEKFQSALDHLSEQIVCSSLMNLLQI